MAEPVLFDGANVTFKGNGETIGDLHTFSNGHSVVSAWRLTPEELDEVKRTGVVFLSVMCGPTLFPVFVGSESVCRGVVLDTGPVWPKSE